MGFVVALGNIRQLSIGRFEFRKRIPEQHKGRIGQGEFKRVFRAFTPAEIAREHARVQAEFEAVVAGKIAEDTGEVAEAVRPEAPAPKPRQNAPQKTFADAVALYERDKLENGRNTKGCTTLKRVCERMETALKVRLNDLKLTEVTREDARKVRDHMLGLRKKTGGTLSPESVKRDMVILSAMTTYALTEFGLDGEHRNPFSALPIPKSKENQIRAIERRDTLPDEIVSAMTPRLSGELNHIWRILAGTGCRLAEVTGLRTQDVRIAGEEIPHIRVTWGNPPISSGVHP